MIVFIYLPLQFQTYTSYLFLDLYILFCVLPAHMLTLQVQLGGAFGGQKKDLDPLEIES